MRYIRFTLMVQVLQVLLVAWPIQARQSAPQWRDTSVQLPSRPLGALCFDADQPDTLLINEEGQGTLSYNWQTGARSLVSDRPFTICGANGWLFGTTPDGAAWRISTRDRQLGTIARLPTLVAQDGTRQVYALDGNQLWASADAGLSWQSHPAPDGWMIASAALVATDARLLYLATLDRSNPAGPLPYRIYFSSDRGATWQLRSSGMAEGDRGYGGPYLTLDRLPGAAPVDILQLRINPGYPGSSNRQQVLVSGDGARSFHQAGTLGLDTGVQLVHSADGIVRLTTVGFSFGLDRSSDGGASWQPLPLPPAQPVYGVRAQIAVAQSAPANLFVAGGGQLWYSPDSGRSWQSFDAPNTDALNLSPYLPLTVVGLSVDGLTVRVLELPDAGASLAAAALPSGAPAGGYFDTTGHNLSPLFRQHWEAGGGLAQFGYARSEPFREVNPADGRIYTVQYFERNRFEYHPEHAGTPYEVLLGLLGNQLTAERRAAGEAPFVPLADPGPTGDAVFFPQTGHTLRGVFRRYWEAHGGLSVYGYPLSEEFREVNPEDGQIYVVQYFERNRFEYHPEHAGTPYEVLLGLLGNVLLRDKGWIE